MLNKFKLSLILNNINQKLQNERHYEILLNMW